ncbi:MAG: branched-chain amino acid ABC transporter permease, partial [Anaerolineae bacterium]
MKQLKNAQPALITGAVVILFLLALFGRFEPKVAVSVLLSGLTLGALYFMMSAGLSLIFGLMDVLNFAHGFLFMLGAYVG